VGELGVELGLELAQLWDGQLGEVDCAMLTKVCDGMWGRRTLPALSLLLGLFRRHVRLSCSHVRRRGRGSEMFGEDAAGAGRGI
jgi:hypothetical protein